MSPEKEAELRKRFPFVSAECKLNFGDGWYQIVAGLCGTLEAQGRPDLRIVAMEYRDNKLNVEYTGGGNCSQVDSLIARFENRSLWTCEKCGHFGKIGAIRNCLIDGKMTKLCDSCR